MIIKVLNEQYPCAKAVRGDDYIRLYNEGGAVIAGFDGILDFGGYELIDGEWSVPEPTVEERLAAAEELLLSMLGVI